MIEQLEYELTQYRQRMETTLKDFADKKEELDITNHHLEQEKTNADVAQARFRSEKQSLENEIQKIKDENLDKDEKIENLTTTVQIERSGKNFIKKSYDALMAKFKRIEEENFLIPKKSKDEAEEAKSSSKETGSSTASSS